MKTAADSPCGVCGPTLGWSDCCAARFASAGNIFIIVLLLIAVVGLLGTAPTQAGEPERKETEHVVKVGPQREIKTLREASRIAQAGDTVEVDAGDYLHDVTVWMQAKLKIKAVGGRVRMIADGMSAEGKAIWVLRGGAISVEGFDFIGAKVNDRNGAGIRLEKGNLFVRDCRFLDNENGILTGGNPEATLEIINSEFGNNGHGDGQSHNLYVGTIARLTVIGSYFHHARVGHLLKSRAAENHIFYNRLTDEVGGKASYELELPSGGVGYIVGNLIQQNSTTENPHLISYGAEGYRWPNNALYLINNTLVDNRPQGGIFLRMKPGQQKVVAVNNLLVGKGKLESAGPGDYRNNFNVDWDQFVQAVREDYRLLPNAGLRYKAVEPPIVPGVNLRPAKEYLHPRSTRSTGGVPLSPGAFQTSTPP
ncbi:MAG: hypothetical protein CVU33_10570 [Betaproteobacteria bacterium HGW-Betaproteobacteria-6]|jgi:hypothetical protein|nr:MAG: hypothetical protein CVU33_10570 [Betaproteobacteria bacterium HGW-Betaproteobacteria-6]